MVRGSPKKHVPAGPPSRNFAQRGIAALLAPVVRPAYRKRAPAAAQLLVDWEALAGPDFCNRAAPLKFHGGTLTLGCTGPASMELQYEAPALMARLNLAVGSQMIERLRFVAQNPVSAQMPPLKRHAQMAMKLPENLPPGPLGEALAKLYNGLAGKP